MAKKTKSELVEEGRRLSDDIAAIRKSEHNFALQIGSEGVFLAVHRTKGTTALKNEARAAGGNPAKGALGIVSLEGKVLSFKCADGEEPPAMLGKRFKMHLKERGLILKVQILDHTGAVLEGDEEPQDDTAAPTPSPPADATVKPVTPALQPSALSASTPPQPEPEDIATRLKTALAKLVPTLKALPDGAKKTEAGTLVARFQSALATSDFADAMTALTDMRILLTPGKAAEKAVSGVSAKALLERGDLISRTADKANTDAGYFAEAAPKLRDLRAGLKTALASTPAPAPEDLAKLLALKKKLDQAFLSHLKRQGHGPQRHEGDVTTVQLDDRCQNGINPQTGTTFDDAAGTKPHGYSANATRFIDAGDYVDAEAFCAASPLMVTAKAEATRLGNTRFDVTIPLMDVLGAAYKTRIEGKTRTGSKKHPTGSTATDFTDGKLIAVYDLGADGSVTLLTMYPDPK